MRRLPHLIGAAEALHEARPGEQLCWPRQNVACHRFEADAACQTPLHPSVGTSILEEKRTEDDCNDCHQL